MSINDFNEYVSAYNKGIANGDKLVYVNGVEYHIGFLHYWIQASYKDVMLKEK